MSSLSSAPSSVSSSVPSSVSSPVAQGLFDEPDPSSTWCGPRFVDAEELEAAAPLPPPPAAPRPAASPPRVEHVAASPQPSPPPLPSAANRPTPRQLAITIVASLGLVVASAFVSQYLFTYLFTGHW